VGSAVVAAHVDDIVWTPPPTFPSINHVVSVETPPNGVVEPTTKTETQFVIGVL